MTTETTTTQRVQKPRRRFGWYLLALPVLIGAASFSVARAHGPGGRGEFGEFMQWRVGHMLDSVKATDAQKQQIKTVFEGLRPQQQALREEQHKLRQQIETALTAPAIDTAAIEKLRQQSVQLMDKGSSLFTQGLVNAAKVLTPDQRKQLLAKMQERREHRGDHGDHGGWHGRGHGPEQGAAGKKAD